MISDKPVFEAFIDKHRWAVLTTLRASGSPVSSVVAYAREGDELLVSTPGKTFKHRSLERDERANLCIISNAEPFNFVALEGKVAIQTDDLMEATRLIFKNIAETGYQEPENLADWLKTQERVILRISPTRMHGVIR